MVDQSDEMSEAKYKHFGCADCYEAAIKFVNKIGKNNLIAITSNSSFSGIRQEKYRDVVNKAEKVTVWYWKES